MTPRTPLAAGERTFIRRLRASDRTEFLDRARASVQLHDRWSDPPKTDEAFDEFMRRARRPSEERLLVCRTEDVAIVGQFSLSQIFYGPFRNAYLGYYAFVPFAGHGYMREGLQLVIAHAFDALGLHRLQANVQPENEPSLSLIRGAGFSKEGFSPRYLMIGGEWRDHEQWALLVEDHRRRADDLGPRAAAT